MPVQRGWQPTASVWSSRLVGVGLAAAAVVIAVVWLARERDEPPQTASYGVVPGWPVLREPIGHVSGLGVDARGNVLVFHRAGRNWDGNTMPTDATIPAATLPTLDVGTGTPRAARGARTFAMPHGLAVAADGGVWVTDVGRHQVLRLDSEGRTLLELGERALLGHARIRARTARHTARDRRRR